MAQTFEKNKLSGSTNGRGIKITATATPGTLIHTAVSGTTNWDEIFLFVANTDTVERKLTIEYGGTTSPDDLIEVPIPPESGLVAVLPGLIVNNGVAVRAFAASANVLIGFGYIHEVRTV